jgi:hypothetical protein
MHALRHTSPRRTGLLSLLVIGAVIAGLAMLAPASRAAGTCTDTVTWSGLSGHVNSDTCATGVQITAACAGASITGNAVSNAGDDFSLSGYDSFAENCVNTGADPIIFLRFMERGAWKQIGSEYYSPVNGTYSDSWPSR